MALEPSKNPPITETGGGGNWLTGVIGSLPSIISALFPSGVTGNNNQPVVTTSPTGTTNVKMPANNNSFIIIGIVAIAGVILLTRSPSKTI